MTESARSNPRLLSSRINGHDNNFNLIRVTAALLVLVSHSFAVVTGSGDAEPLRVSHGVTLGSIAVDMFFIVSGLLVTHSIAKRDSALAFVRARVLRIWPGLLVSLLLTAYALGAIVTSLAPAAYLMSTDVLGYVLRGVLLSLDLAFSHLPGVFAHNPHRDTVNVSLWTLPVEVRMYSELLVFWVATRLVGPQKKRAAFGAVIVLAFAYCALRHLMNWHGSVEASNYRLPFMFFTGAAAAVFADRIAVSPALGAIAAAVMLIGALLAGSAFYFAYSATLGCLVLCAAYLPGGAIRRYNAVGDYSYGLYIYAWPIQQALIFAVPGLWVGWHILWSIVVTLPLAAASWHLIEKPAMGLKRLRARAAAVRAVEPCPAR
ncbi:MAG: acyltransferase [Burkholderiales bacterium]